MVNQSEPRISDNTPIEEPSFKSEETSLLRHVWTCFKQHVTRAPIIIEVTKHMTRCGTTKATVTNSKYASKLTCESFSLYRKVLNSLSPAAEASTTYSSLASYNMLNVTIQYFHEPLLDEDQICTRSDDFLSEEVIKLLSKPKQEPAPHESTPSKTLLNNVQAITDHSPTKPSDTNQPLSDLPEPTKLSSKNQNITIPLEVNLNNDNNINININLIITQQPIPQPKTTYELVTHNQPPNMTKTYESQQPIHELEFYRQHLLNLRHQQYRFVHPTLTTQPRTIFNKVSTFFFDTEQPPQLVLPDASLRIAFRHMSLRQSSTQLGNHTHAAAAKNRNSAIRSILQLISAKGYTPVPLLKPDGEVPKWAIDHVRTIPTIFVPRAIDPKTNSCFDAWIEDTRHENHYTSWLGLNNQARVDDSSLILTTNGQLFNNLHKNIFVCNNSDYYYDYTNYLHPGLQQVGYTFNPRTISGSANGVSWTTLDGLTFDVKVDGGGSYSHPVWDHSSDVKYIQTPYGILKVSTELTRLDDAYCIFHLYVNTATWPGPLSTYKRLKIQMITNTSKVKNDKGVIHSDKETSFLYRNVMVDGIVHHQIAQPGSTVTHTLRDDLLDACRNSNLIDPVVSVAHISTILQAFYKTHDSDPVTRSITTQVQILLRTGITKVIPNTIPFSVTDNMISEYTAPTQDLLVAIDKKKSDIQEPITKTLSPPILDTHAVVPFKTYANTMATLQNRVVLQHNPIHALPEKYENHAQTFISLIHQSIGELAPIPLQEILEQATPAQKQKWVTAVDEFMTKTDMILTVPAFQKKEAYAEAKDPRNISAVPPIHVVNFSQLTKSLANALKMYTRFYAFGLTFEQLDARLAEVFNDCEQVSECDMSRFDGTHSYAMYDLMKRLLLLCFPHEHRNIHHIYNQMVHNSRGHANFNVYYQFLGSRLSGSADTSVGNTIVSTFVAYSALREEHREWSPQRCFDSLGVYAGDDSVSKFISTPVYEQVCKDLGFKPKVKQIDRNYPVSFLGRIHPNLWEEQGSLADLPRQLRKLSVGLDTSISIDQAVRNKALGYYMIDSSTPILREWITTAIRLTGGPPQSHEFKSNQLSYTAQHTTTKYQPRMPEHIALAEVARQLEITEEEVIAFSDQLLNATSLSTLPTLRPCQQPISKENNVGPNLASNPTKQYAPKYKCPKDKNPPEAEKLRPPRNNTTTDHSQTNTKSPQRMSSSTNLPNPESKTPPSPIVSTLVPSMPGTQKTQSRYKSSNSIPVSHKPFHGAQQSRKHTKVTQSRRSSSTTHPVSVRTRTDQS